MKLSLNILNLIKSEIFESEKYYMIPAEPAVGLLYITKNNPAFISGQLRMRSNGGGRYPSKYIEMIDTIFGYESNTIEVCSNSVSNKDCFTVDINPKYNPSCVDNAETLDKIQSNSFSRYRSDQPYRKETAKKMYGTKLPDTGKMLKAAHRVVVDGALIFMLLGNMNRQIVPIGLKRIGWIPISCIPSNELRGLHIFIKTNDEQNNFQKLCACGCTSNACNDILDIKSASDNGYTLAEEVM